MYIGITERGDAGIDFSWIKQIQTNPAIQGAILITKNCNEQFQNEVMNLHQNGYPLLVHATCTGFGGTQLEPNVPAYPIQLKQLQNLIAKGFPKEQCVLRIDPIFPTPNGIKMAKAVLDEAIQLKLLPGLRIRISIYDEYKHIIPRYRTIGFDAIYPNHSFYAPKQWILNAKAMLMQYPFIYECCAEPNLIDGTQFLLQGCISIQDLKILQLYDQQTFTVNPQNRSGCACLSCKRELLTTKHPCKHQCLYCFWKN